MFNFSNRFFGFLKLIINLFFLCFLGIVKIDNIEVFFFVDFIGVIKVFINKRKIVF